MKKYCGSYTIDCVQFKSHLESQRQAASRLCFPGGSLTLPTPMEGDLSSEVDVFHCHRPSSVFIHPSIKLNIGLNQIFFFACDSSSRRVSIIPHISQSVRSSPHPNIIMPYNNILFGGKTVATASQLCDASHVRSERGVWTPHGNGPCPRSASLIAHDGDTLRNATAPSLVNLIMVPGLTD